jgi:SAM-dependent methyltransferase
MAEKHYYEQESYSNNYLLPFLEKRLRRFSPEEYRILEVGCAEGGTLASLAARGFSCAGMEIVEGRAAIAKAKLPKGFPVFVGDVTAADQPNLTKDYNLILIRDVIEHIEDKAAALRTLHSQLSDNGRVFITFPLKYSPYAGHQQTAKSWLKFIVYITLLPSFLIRILCNLAGEKSQVNELLYLKKTALSFCYFKKLIKADWQIEHIDFYISRPVYKERFGWPIIKMPSILALRELANGAEVIIKKK